MAKSNNVKHKKSKVKISNAIVHVCSRFNNTIITISDEVGNTLAWASSGSCGFKGAKQATPFAAGEAAKKAMQAACDMYGVSSIKIILNGPGAGRDSAINGVISILANIKSKSKKPLANTKDSSGSSEEGEEGSSSVGSVATVVSIEDITGMPHNGCRPSKQRRV